MADDSEFLRDPVAHLGQRLVFERVQYALQQYLPGHVINDVEIDVFHVDYAASALAIRLAKEVWAHKLPPSHYVATTRVPQGTWQTWKSLHAPAWFVRRWPVKTMGLTLRVDITPMITFPDFEAPPSAGSRYHVFQADGPWWETPGAGDR